MSLCSSERQTFIGKGVVFWGNPERWHRFAKLPGDIEQSINWNIITAIPFSGGPYEHKPGRQQLRQFYR